MDELSLLLTIPEACRLGRVSRTTIYAEITSGRLPIKKVGRLTRIRRSDLEAWAAGDVTRDVSPVRRVARRRS